uniref:Ubiquitin C-terminal hydrolase L1 n=1 Tax=Equus caballus TaxID=9796 RepID=A0A3Q2HT30_HORSE
WGRGGDSSQAGVRARRGPSRPRPPAGAPTCLSPRAWPTCLFRRCWPGWGSPASGASWTCWGWRRRLWARCQRLPAPCCCCFPSRPRWSSSYKYAWIYVPQRLSIRYKKDEMILGSHSSALSTSCLSFLKGDPI